MQMPNKNGRHQKNANITKNEHKFHRKFCIYTGDTLTRARVHTHHIL